MARGMVTQFIEEKGYGFIRPDGDGEDVFVHYADMAGKGYRSLKEGEKVAFEVRGRGRKGPRARNVRKVGATGAGS
jgi:cold shock protein